MKKVTVTWFHTLKGFGEGKTETGQKVFLKLSVVKPCGDIAHLQAGQTVACNLAKVENCLVATAIDTTAFQSKRRSRTGRPALRVVEASQ